MRWPLVLAAAFVGLVVYRATVVENRFAEYVGCPDCFLFPSLSADGWLLALMAALVLAAANIPSRLLAAGVGLVTALLLLLYIGDLVVLQLFGIRLFFVDIAAYGVETAAVWDQLTGIFGGMGPALAVLTLLLGVCLVPVLIPALAGRWTNGLLAALMVSSLALAIVPDEPEYVNDWIYKNFLQANLHSGESVAYSDPVAEGHQRAYEERWPHRCLDGRSERPNVVVVVIESWSSYQSQAFGGLYDWTPELDAIARDHVRFTNFHAGGFSTNEGLVNLLGGVRLWAPFEHFFKASEFSHAWEIERSLPGLFNEHGYRTAKLTTGPLAFMRKGEWFDHIGFDEVEGNEHPFYLDWPQISFHAPPDEALYRRSLDWIDSAGDEPYLLVMQTVTTHQPYTHPETGKSDMEGTFAYADEWAAWFHDQLKDSGFFDDGVLLITSDHRSMDPVRSGEREKFGHAAPSLIPMIVVDGDWTGPSKVDQVRQLSDVLPGFEHRLSADEVCLGEFEASLFEDPPHADSCVFHLRGGERGIVNVLCDSGEGQVRLDGDDTRFRWSEGLSDDRKARLLDAIATERMEGVRRFEAATEAGLE